MGKEIISNELRASIRDAIGSKVKVEQIQSVLLELKADKFEPRVLLLSKHRCYIAIPKIPVKIENNFHFLEVSSLESKSQKKLTVHLPEGKRHTFCIDEDGKQLDVVVGHIMLSLVGTFPSVPLEKLIVNIDVKPVMRLKEFHDKIPSVQQKALTNPCDNFSMAYQSMCDLFAVEFMEDVAWDIDTIYLSHGTREMNLGDFDHLLDARAMATIVSALEHNRWFTGFNASNVKLSPAAANELVKVLKNNTTLEELVLPCSAIKAELLHRLSLSIAANSGSSLTVLDLSDNIIEDKGVISICMPLTKLGHGLKKLKLSRTGLTAVGVCRVADTLQNNTNMLSTLTHLDLSYNALRGEDITSLYSFLAQPNALTKLMLVSIDSPLENLFATLLRGCTRCLAHLDLSGNYYSSKKQTSKEISVPLTWQQFFSSSCALKIVSFANVRLPAEAVKSVLLGISTNSTLKDVELNLSGNALGNSALQVLEACLPTLRNISVLDLSDNGFDSTLASLIGILSQNRSIRKLALGRNLNNVKQSAVNQTMEALVGLIQIEGSSIEHLVLDDLKLRAETTILINALGLNNSLTHLDISGNQMGDLGARMLSKALQINKKLISVQWDQNGTSPAGFQLIALALEKNYTLKEMPTPLNDATVALKNNQAKTEKALRKIEQLIQRNHCPQKFVGEQEYRLQLGFLVSSFQQMDSLALQIQNSLAKLEKIGKVATETEVVMKQASALLKDADASRQLLLQLEKVAFKAESQESRIGQSLSTYAKDLGDVVERQLKDTASEMVHCAHSHCPVVLETEDQREAVRDACLEEIKLQPCLIQSLVIEQIGTEIFNKTAELNLAIATSLSDRIADDVIILLGSCNEKLITALRREARSGGHLEGNTAESKEMRKVLLRQSTLNSELGDESLDAVNGELPVVNDKRKTMLMRRNRPMSNIEIPESEPVSSEQIPTTPKISSPSVDKQPSSPSVQKKPTTPKVIKSKVDGLDLPVDTEVPKLQYLGADRPRRPKNKAMTRPTVGLDISTSSIVESNSGVVDVGVDDFFSANRDTVASPSSTPVILNGEQENIVTKDQKKLKSQTSKSESKGISGFMKGLMSKVQSGKNSGVVESSPTQPCEGSDIAPNKSPSNTLEKFQNKSPSNTLERSQSKSPSNTLEKGKSPTVQLERGHSFGAGDATKEKAGPVAPTTVPPRPVAVPRYGLPGMSANVINELPKRVKSQTAEDDKPKVDASSAPEGGGKEIVLNSTAGNGRERPIPSRYQPDKPDKPDKEHSASTSSSTSLDKEPSQATQLPALGPKDHSISSYHPVPSSRRLLSTYATDDAKDTLVATVIEDPAKQASAVVDNDEVNVGSRITSVPKAAQRAPPPLAPKPKPKRGTIIEEVPVEGPSKTPSFKAQSSEVEREQLDSQKSVKLVEQSESDADKGEKLDRNSNVKRASDVSIEMDNKEEDEETSETRSQPLPANRLSSLSSTIDSDGGSDSIAHSDSERHSSLEHSISSDSQVDAKNDNVTSAEQADPMQPAFL